MVRQLIHELLFLCFAYVQEAASVTLSYTVAYLLVHDLANIASGHTVLLHSAGGAVVSWGLLSWLLLATLLVADIHDLADFF